MRAMLALLLMVAPVLAAESTLEWDAPPKNADGSVIENRLTYTLQWRESGHVLWQEVATTNTEATVTHRQNKICEARVKATNEVGEESPWSDVLVEAFKKVPPGSPGKPRKK